MPKKRDLNTIAELERAITKKYGEKAVQHPRSNWDENKEKEYLEQLKKLLEKEDKTKEKVEKVEKDGFLISKKLLWHVIADTFDERNFLFLCFYLE